MNFVEFAVPVFLSLMRMSISNQVKFLTAAFEQTLLFGQRQPVMAAFHRSSYYWLLQIFFWCVRHEVYLHPSSFARAMATLFHSFYQHLLQAPFFPSNFPYFIFCQSGYSSDHHHPKSFVP
jgi:hypothetical protein